MADLKAIGGRSLGELPASIYMTVRDNLDVNEPNTGWRAFAAVLDGNYIIENLAAIERDVSPTTRLLQFLSSRGMTIKEFVKYADRAENYFILQLFNVYVPVQITQHPWDEMHVVEGETVSLTVKAKGFPPPKFMWCKDQAIIEGAVYGTYQFEAQSERDSGIYYCLVYNREDPDALFMMSNPTTLRVLPSPDLEVTEHPRSCTVSLGGTALFKCEVWGEDKCLYQWFLDKNELHDQPDQIQGSNTKELRLYKVSEDLLGCYSCKVSRGSKFVMTKGAVLQISNSMLSQHTAVDKVALLIGNYDYRGDPVLSAPKYDVQTLSQIFQSLNFKVVSLLNLTKSEMTAAVQEFRKLVGRGVYCVFYFCGHGFQISSQCFLVPTDAPNGYIHDHCISADVIFNSLLQQEPQICCMILDICRKSREEQIKASLLVQNVVEKGNAIVCYGTSFGLAAYEDRNYGILVSHLKNVLSLPVDIETVFKKLREEIARDRKINRESSENPCRQIPEVRTNLLEVNRSFTDKIEYKGHTEVYNERKRMWENAHKKPEPMILEFHFPNFCVKVKLDFQQDFSNVLKIYTSVLDPGPTRTCTAFVSGIPADIAEKAKITAISHGIGDRLCKNYVVIHNIQRLKSAMRINVTVQCQDPDLEKVETAELGLPLVARLELWKDRPDLNCQRKPEEVEEDQAAEDLGGLHIAENFQQID